MITWLIIISKNSDRPHYITPSKQLFSLCSEFTLFCFSFLSCVYLFILLPTLSTLSFIFIFFLISPFAVFLLFQSL